MRRRAVVARSGLELNDTQAAVAYFDSIGRLNEYAESRMERDEALRSASGRGSLYERRERAAEVLRDTILPDFGFDSNGRIAYNLGGKTLTVVLENDFSLKMIDDETGKPVKSVPKKGSDPKLYESVKKGVSVCFC